MQPLGFDELDKISDVFDAAVAVTPDIDLYCSSSNWILPAHHAFSPANQSFIYRSDNGFIALSIDTGRNRVLQPLELSWGFPSALIGADPERIVSDLQNVLAARRYDWDLLALGGIVPGSHTFKTLIGSMRGQYRLLRGESTRRFRASLAGGVDGFLSRRSRDFRKSLRRSQAKAQERGITFERADLHVPPDVTYARLLAVDRASWKGRDGVGLEASAMAVHYRLQTRRLHARQTLRLWFARHDGHDVGYILGGMFANTYRGLQFAYNDAYADIGLGNLAQLVTIEAVCAEGATLYDLGSDVAYKARWGEEAFETMTVIATRY